MISGRWTSAGSRSPEAMWRLRLKPMRVAAALLVCGALTAAMMDFREAVPPSVGHWLAAVQFMPAVIALATAGTLGAALIVACLLALTLLFGRVYCSVICPLGVLQDAVVRVAARIRGGPARLPHARPWNRLRYGFLVLALVGVAAGWSGLTLALLDPYSSYGRIAAGLFRPLLVLANNTAVGAAELAGHPILYRVNIPWLRLGVIVLPLGMLILVGALAVWRGRLFCNTACPVGTLLGFLARRAAWRLTIDRSACVKCGDCLQVCKAQCIDLRAGTIDASRCVACFNCIGACAEHGIAYQSVWTPPLRNPAGEAESVDDTDPEEEPEPEPAASLTDGAPADPARRAFLSGAMVLAAASVGAPPRLLALTEDKPVVDDNRSGAVCPPGAAGIDRYLTRCTACHLCVSACPTHVLRPALLEYGFAGWLRPRLDYEKSFCNYDCRRCGEMCPTGAIGLLVLPEKQLTRIGRAILQEDLCVVKRDGTDCAACSEHCPTKAVDTVPFRDGLRLPKVREELCIGCGGCEFACPVVPEKAIKVSGRRRHERAEKAVEAKPIQPAAGDFPF